MEIFNTLGTIFQKTVVLSLVRNIAQWAGATLMGYGWFNNDQATSFVGIIVSIVTLGFSIAESRKAGDAEKVVKTIASAPNNAADILASAIEKSKPIDKMLSDRTGQNDAGF